MKIHEFYLSRCLELAKKGRGSTAPNPSVGAVVAGPGGILGEGFTSAYGGPHAEVNAIRGVSDPERLKEATLYVTLEPCNHHGKTPPCTDLILQMGIPRVVIGLQDPHALVDGSGIARLRGAGCEVITGVLEGACAEHHRRFLTFHREKRPYIILKWAQTSDGYLAPEPAARQGEPAPVWITGPRSRQLVHKWRSEEQAILVGTQTVLADNPGLDTRHWHGKNPLRILWDRQLQVPTDYRIYDNRAETWVIHGQESAEKAPAHVTYLALGREADPLGALMRELHARNIQSLIVEGGARTLETFLQRRLWDEARVFTGPVTFGKGLPAPQVKGRLTATRKVGQDRLDSWRRE
ncbi:bifunctional diaminohydroxyphosphoribosylaminopyrimidine deaminase/5-amino-6-(5-phosphoribosylamino)uracil reductase RibD [Robiginitalea sp. M366]|uniref:bifunctional diaminohydroxyphosphoribosylaminopyrimidine deaminase/5-amino-6-(5-phosphoribosylamino)uracil reductase RibD n=1 Tax=Robiginitalea aestuariiviva TaxID=3036903 RepID=UPI00240E3697|nr:bifunctional diaminohydroxyphosphoribosylaminopyrimidine deaminase/5-amino-6-(5-phosphoribosylamino)uracil reductase RibD [Robiginitalea aestuariiviva]MDG1573145.1 bifunctional diaminohydroxyphosphoribosylaminopyrimidine deaminase/5-amino-6-(5-phosphoribosylamino)uracil reductase RibD [Robiginitalea aestuariiviva]